MRSPETIQLKEFCKLFEVHDREVRYILESGHVPYPVLQMPSTGNRREFKPDHAFWLAIVLKLKHCGIKTPLAAESANYSTAALRGVTQNLGWDWHLVHGQRNPIPNVRPFIVIRVDLVRIAEVLKKVDAWSHPDYTRRS